MTQRLDFVALAKNPSHGHFTELCRRFGISCKTGYEWLARFESEGPSGLKDLSRRPLNHPARTHPKLEKLVLDMRALHPGNGPRKLHRRLLNKGHKKLPAISTFARILSRHGRIEPIESQKHKKSLRFERSVPNALWQMDFKGHFALGRGGRCQSLTVIDDHSRFLLVLKACRDQQGSTVRNAALQEAFALYGLPDSILCDNGSPWGGIPGSYSALADWLLRLGVRLIHGRPWHPQTQGKDERFHSTLKTRAVVPPRLTRFVRHPAALRSLQTRLQS